MAIEPFESLSASPLPDERVAVSSSHTATKGSLFVVCGACRGVLRLPRAAAGMTGRCPSCKTVIQVPARQLDPEQVRRVLRVAIPLVLGLSSALAFVFGLSGVVGAAVSSHAVAGVSWAAAACGGVALTGAVALVYGELGWARRACAIVLATGVPFGILWGVSAVAPALGLGLMLVGGTQLVRPQAPQPQAHPHASRSRVTSRPRPAVESPSAVGSVSF